MFAHRVALWIFCCFHQMFAQGFCVWGLGGAVESRFLLLSPSAVLAREGLAHRVRGPHPVLAWPGEAS